MKIKKNENNSIASMMLKKELTCDVPVLGTYFLLFLGVTNALFFLSVNESSLFFGVFFLLFLGLNGIVQGKKSYYQGVFREKALAMECPLHSVYKHQRGGAGWCTYALLNEETYAKFLSLELDETPLPLSQEVASMGPFCKKIMVEKVSSKNQIGKTIGDFDTRLKMKGKMT